MTSSPSWSDLTDEAFSTPWIKKLKAENADLRARETYLKARESELKDRVKTLKTDISKLTESRSYAVRDNIKLQKQLDNAKLIVEDYSKVLGTMGQVLTWQAQPHVDFTRPPKRMRVE